MIMNESWIMTVQTPPIHPQRPAWESSKYVSWQKNHEKKTRGAARPQREQPVKGGGGTGYLKGPISIVWDSLVLQARHISHGTVFDLKVIPVAKPEIRIYAGRDGKFPGFQKNSGAEIYYGGTVKAIAAFFI